VHRIPFSEVLRIIGQDLEMRGIKTFDIQSEVETVFVRCGYQAPPAEMPVTLHYTPGDLEELRIAGQEGRGQSAEPKDFYSLSQTLRAIGGYVEQKKGCLVRLANDGLLGADVVFRIEYKTAGGERLIEEYSSSAVYDICVSMYKRRGKFPAKADKYARWRR
jgi:hypothetical protein